MYAGAMMTQEQIARILGVTQQAVSKMLKQPAYREAWERGRANTEFKLKQKQIDSALEGDRTMLIWTGKQYLDQRDSPKEIEVNQNVQVKYIAEWGGKPPDEVTAGEDMMLIEGEVEED